MRRFTFEAIGTNWQIEIFEDVSEAMFISIQNSIRERIEVYDKHYSRFRSDSLVTRMSQKSGHYTLPDDARPLFDLYEQLYELTDGALTPLIGQTLAGAGYDKDYSLTPGVVRTPPSWQEALKYDFPGLRIIKPSLLDVGAAGKGYLTDIIGVLLGERGVHRYCINAGGDIVYRSDTEDAIEIALEHPEDPKLAIGVARLCNQSLCGSSGNRRRWSTYHHIIDPHTLRSPHHIAAVWVTAANGLLADGIATALFFTEPATLQKAFQFEYAILNADFSLIHSPDFPADFFTSNTNETMS